MQEVSDLLASGLGGSDPEFDALHGLDSTSWERGRWPLKQGQAQEALTE